MAAKAKTIDDVLASVGADQRAALAKLRKTIQAAAPKAEECISYGLAAFRLDGKPLVAFGATANHCAFYPMSSTTVADHRDELQDYDTSKGTIRFSADKPLPVALVKKLVKARIAENARSQEGKSSKRAMDRSVETVVATLKRLGTQKTRDGMARYAIPSDKAFGVTVRELTQLAKQLGKNHQLAAELWDTGWYEARMLAAMVDKTERVTPAQMDRWCRDFDNWAVGDHACFHLFDRTPHAFKKVEQWSSRKPEFEKRAAFALLWGLTVHDKETGDKPFLRGLELIEAAANDERNFVKKAVNMALRAIGKRNSALNAAAMKVAQRLAASTDATARWVGKDALRELTSASVIRRLGKR